MNSATRVVFYYFQLKAKISMYRVICTVIYKDWHHWQKIGIQYKAQTLLGMLLALQTHFSVEG